MTTQHDTPPEPAPDEELFAAFANMFDMHDGRPEETIRDGASLRAWLEEHGLVTTTSDATAERAVPAFQALRALVHEITEALVARGRPTADQVARLNAVLRDGLHYHELREASDGATFTVGQVGDELDQARAAIAGSLAHYIAEHDVSRLRICAADSCRWRFVDRSPSRRRRWCDMRTCGNRAKVARHRARARAAAEGD